MTEWLWISDLMHILGSLMRLLFVQNCLQHFCFRISRNKTSMFWPPLLLFLSVFIIWVRCDNGVELTACVLMERGTDDLFYNYDRHVAAMDLAVDYANDEILSSRQIKLTKYYVDIGPKCETKNHIVSFAIDLFEKGMDCSVFIGPGVPKLNLQLYKEIFDHMIKPVLLRLRVSHGSIV